jgi:uncharacterized RmlC-like cupin family protein
MVMSFLNEITEESYYTNAQAGTCKRSNLVVVSTPEERISKVNLPFLAGISGETAGSKGICMNIVRIPPGGAGLPHIHEGFESAIYILKGEVEVLYGPYLSNKTVCREGDFVYIGANVPHQPVNLSTTAEMTAVVSRTHCNGQESVVLYNPQTDKLKRTKGKKQVY